MRLAPLLALTIALTTHAFAEGERQYVALTQSGQGIILWTDRLAATNCARATFRGTEQERLELREDGTAGRSPRWGCRRGNRGGATRSVGVWRPGTGRVLTGALTGGFAASRGAAWRASDHRDAPSGALSQCGRGCDGLARLAVLRRAHRGPDQRVGPSFTVAQAILDSRRGSRRRPRPHRRALRYSPCTAHPLGGVRRARADRSDTTRLLAWPAYYLGAVAPYPLSPLSSPPRRRTGRVGRHSMR